MRDALVKAQGSNPCFLGCVSYWSFLPLIAELRRLSGNVDLSFNHSDQLVSMIENHELDLTFCSSTGLLSSSELELALPVGESISGPVGAAYLGLCEDSINLKHEIQFRLQDLRQIFRQALDLRTDDVADRVALIYDATRSLEKTRPKLAPRMKICGNSTSYTALARLIYRLLFGEGALGTLEMMSSAYQSHCDSTDHGIELRQGNEAIARRCSYSQSLDLVEVWNDLTQLPFVSHVLVKSTRAGLNQNLRNQLLKACELAQVKMHVEPSAYLPDLVPVNLNGNRIDLIHIWKNINYKLNAESIKSLRLFLQLVRPFEKKRMADEAFRLRMIRWQQREHDADFLSI